MGSFLRMEKRGVALTAVIGGVIIFSIKLIAFMVSGSVALLSDALESTVNIIASMLMFYAVYVSSKPADEEHQYGHERIENISCLLEGVLILMAAIFIIHTSIERLYNPVELLNIDIAVVISIVATGLNGGLSYFLARNAETWNSPAFEGDSKHLMSDVITSGGVAVGLFIGNVLKLEFIDPLIALLVSGIIIFIGSNLVYKSAKGLMDQSSPVQDAKIKEILTRHSSQYVDFHNVKTRRSGNKVFAELHLSFKGDTTVDEAHNLAHHLEEDVANVLPEVIITIHIDSSV